MMPLKIDIDKLSEDEKEDLRKLLCEVVGLDYEKLKPKKER